MPHFPPVVFAIAFAALSMSHANAQAASLGSARADDWRRYDALVDTQVKLELPNRIVEGINECCAVANVTPQSLGGLGIGELFLGDRGHRHRRTGARRHQPSRSRCLDERLREPGWNG